MKRTIMLAMITGLMLLSSPSLGSITPPPEEFTFGTPSCEAGRYPFDKPENDENYTYYADVANPDGDGRTLVFTVEDTKTGEVVGTPVKHRYPAFDDSTCDDPAVEKPALPNTGG
jgi:hypothetical protein